MKRLFILLSICLIIGCGKSKSRFALDTSGAREALAKADQLWDAGKKADAVDAYTSLMYGREGVRYIHFEAPGEAPRIYRRVIDYKIEVGGLEATRADIEDALQKRVSLSLSTREANEFVAKIREERERQHPKAESKASTSRGGTASEGVSKAEMEKLFEALLTKNVKPGMTANQVKAILGEPHEITRNVPNTQNFEIWKWRQKGGDDNFIMLGFENGVLVSGGSPGYDIEKGFRLRK